MGGYLSWNTKDLENWQIIEMISGGKVSLDRKREHFIQLSLWVEANRAISKNAEGAFYLNLKKECCKLVMEIDRAIENLRIQGKEDGSLLVHKNILVNNAHKTLEVLYFYDYRKLERYFQEQEAEYKENSQTMDHVWYEIERYRENSNGDLEEFCFYIVINGEIVYYSNYMTNDFLPNPDLNLSVPFMSGDIISADSLPLCRGKAGGHFRSGR